MHLAILFLTLLTLLFSPSTSSSLPNSPSRQTRRDDIIGIYVRHPETALIADDDYCPPNISVPTYFYEPAEYPPEVEAPKAYNIEIPLANVRVGDRRCPPGSLYAVPYDHPFVNDSAAAVRAWAGVGKISDPVPWLVNSSFVTASTLEAWVIAYHFDTFYCGRYQIPSAAYLWIQPSKTEYINNVELLPTMKYLIMTFSGDRIQGCLYNAVIVGGQDDFPPGPVSDKSNPSAPNKPPSLGQWTASPSPSKGQTVQTTPDVAEIPAGSNEPLLMSDEPTDDSDTKPPTDGTAPVFENPSTTSGQSGSTPTDKSCFPADALVSLIGGSTIPMRAVKLGHQARVSLNTFSPVFFFSHRDESPDTFHDFIQISTQSGHTLRLSPGHYVHTASGQLVQASSIRTKKHALILANGMASVVTDVRKISARGLYAPHTIHGDIVVDGVLVSTYTSAVNPWLAHYVLLSPVRILFRLGLHVKISNLFRNGAPHLARLVPSGPSQLQRFF